jgi:23S rRNA-/tRNA-specific pseudouridylate synthase
MIDEKKGKESKTAFYLIDYSEETNTSIIFCRPFTGRTHQIRVHLQSLGFSIINDPIYGESEEVENIEPPLKKRKREVFVDELCSECLNGQSYPDSFMLFLHSWMYKSDNFEFRTVLPKWIKFSNEDVEKKLQEFELKISQSL